MRYLLLSVIGLLCAFAGLYSADKLKKRRDALRSVSSTLKTLCDEIFYKQTPLRNAIVPSGTLAGYFEAIRDAVACGAPPDDPAEERQADLLQCGLTEDEARTLTECFSVVGRSVKESQRRSLIDYIAVFDKAAAQAEEECARGSKVRVMLGILGGLAAIIFLI